MGSESGVRFVWINSDASENRLGRLWDCEAGNPIAEGANGGFIYGMPEAGRMIIDALNAARRKETEREARRGE